jgi:hypothetical protein
MKPSLSHSLLQTKKEQSPKAIPKSNLTENRATQGGTPKLCKFVTNPTEPSS